MRRPRCWTAEHARDAARLGAHVVDLAWFPLSPEMVKVRDEMRARWGPVKPLADHWRDEFARQSAVLERIDDGSVLDVGVAHGIFSSACVYAERFDRVVGIDIAEYGPYLNAGFDHRSMDVTQASFDDDEFDVAVAMEVIEHIPGDGMLRAVEQLRRVARRRIITIPWLEAPPLYRGHYHRFDADDVGRMFPDAEYVVLACGNRRTPWILIDESD